MLRYLLPLALPVALLAACTGTEKTKDAAATTASARPATIPMTVTSGTHRHRFAMEVAITAEEQAKGLMFRKALPANGGMIFPMDPPRIASFWMKDTFIPLDMLFVRTDGTVAMVAANVQPYSRIPVSAGIPVAGVVELPGGRAAELGISEGAHVTWGNCAAPARPDKAWDSLNFCP